MKHAYLDEYSGRNSFIHRLEPRIKLISFTACILFIISTKASSGLSFALYAAILLALNLTAKLPLTAVIKRSLTILPFVVLATIFIPLFKPGDGLMILWNCLIKAYLSVICMIILTATTKFSDLLKALELLRFPVLFLMIVSFMYRYIFVIEDALMKMNQAREARSPAGRRWLGNKVLANILGVLFIRTYEQAERVYLAMCARGFSGRIKTLSDFRMREIDFAFLGLITAVLSIIRWAVK